MRYIVVEIPKFLTAFVRQLLRWCDSAVNFRIIALLRSGEDVSSKSSSMRIYWKPERPVVGIMAFEISSMMSKVVNIWHSLSNRQNARLREEIANSVGIHRLVSQDDNYLMDLALAEIIENFTTLGKSVAKLGKKCADATYHNLETVFDDPSVADPKWCGWQYRLKKMDRKVRKMERFVAATEQLHSELESLAELESSLKRMQDGTDLGKMKLFEFEQKVLWQRQVVRRVQEMSPWVRTYDYVVRVLVRALFTVIARFKFAYLSDQIGNLECLKMWSSLALEGDKDVLKSRRFCDQNALLVRCGKDKMKGGSVSPLVECDEREETSTKEGCFFNSRLSLLDALPSSLGYAALQLHYANLIILMEKMASSPMGLDRDARGDLYDMLPATIRSHLRARMKRFSYCSAAMGGEWSLSVSKILEWLSPLAHNMIRWQSERSFGRQRVVCGSSVLLVQTLYFANQAETEAAIVELLMGLILWNQNRTVNHIPMITVSNSNRRFSYGVNR